MQSTPSNPTPTSIEVLNDLDGGVFAEKIGVALSEVALFTCLYGGKGGRVTIQIDMARIGDSSQVEMAHTLIYKHATQKGEITEKNTTITPMHVGRGGVLSLVPHDQRSLFSEPLPPPRATQRPSTAEQGGAQ